MIVYVSLSDGTGARNLVQETSSRLTIVPCDVTSDDSVQRAKEIIKKELKTQGKGKENSSVVVLSFVPDV